MRTLASILSYRPVIITLAVLLAVFNPRCIWAQAGSATMSGRVSDETGALVSEAEIQLTNRDTGLVTLRESGGAGAYTFSSLKPGRYQLDIRKSGFQSISVQDITLNVNDDAVRDFVLHLGSSGEFVTVNGDTVSPNTTDATISTVIDRQFVETLPLNGRSFHALLELTPGTVLTKAAEGTEQGQFSINGQRADANYFVIDGVGANFAAGAAGGGHEQHANGGLPALSVQGGTSNLVSVDALQEFRMETSTYAPEFGRTAGAQVVLITRSGTNKLHGSAFDYLRNGAMDATDWFEGRFQTGKAALRQNDFGGVLGGPLKKDKTFFFLSYEGLRVVAPQFELADVPSLEARQSALPSVAPLLNAYPLPNGPETAPDANQFTSSFSNPSSLDAFSVRIDHVLGPRHTLFARYNYSPSQADLRGSLATPSELQHVKDTTQTLTIGLTSQFTPSLTNELRFNYSRDISGINFTLDDFGGATVPDDEVIFPAGFGTSATSDGGIGVIIGLRNSQWQTGVNTKDSLQRQINVTDSIGISSGTHSLKFGGDYRRLAPTVSNRFSLVFPLVLSVADLAAGDAFLTVLQVNPVPSPSFLYRNFSAFAQDTWRVNPRLTFNYGIRWDVNPPPTETTGNPPYAITRISDLSSIALRPKGSSLWDTRWGNVAPRIGLAYQLQGSNDRTTVIRAGAGLFYDLGTATSGGLLNNGTYPYGATFFVPGLKLPLDIPLPTSPTEPPFPSTSVFDPELKAPYSPQWSLAVEQGLSATDAVSLSYVGSLGRRLLREVFVNNPNPTFEFLFLTDNSSYSNYNGLQLQYRHRMSKGVQALVSYTWAHSLDVSSSNTAYGGNPLPAALGIQGEYGPSDFDVAHSFSAGITYNIPFRSSVFVLKQVLSDWSVQSVIQGHTATPFDVTYTPSSSLFNDAFGPQPLRADLVPGAPFWIDDASAPGGKKLNPAAFTHPDIGTRQGTESRNALRGFGVFQADVSLIREFRIRDAAKLQFKADAFNVLNHPNFGDPQSDLTTAGFGTSTNMLGGSLGSSSGFGGGFNPLYQIGGPRSLQVSLKLSF